MSTNIDEREFELINIIGSKIGANQRDLSRLMDLSLGMTNMLVRRLIAKGYIRIQQLNKRKVGYILTPQGFAEKMHKSVNYTLKTINSIGLIKGRIKEVILQLHREGERKFFLFGKSDLVNLLKMVFEDIELKDCTIFQPEKLPCDGIDGVLLVCTEHFEANGIPIRKQINMIEELSRDSLLVDAR